MPNFGKHLDNLEAVKINCESREYVDNMVDTYKKYLNEALDNGVGRVKKKQRKF